VELLQAKNAAIKRNSSGKILNFIANQISISKSNRLLCQAIIEAQLPFRITMNERFRLFCKHISGGQYAPPHRNSITSYIRVLFDEHIMHIQNVFKNVQSVSFTTDCCILPRTSDIYICLTAHYINDQWDMKDIVVAIQYLPDGQKSDKIVRFVEKALSYWGINQKVNALVTDGGTNFIRAANDLREETIISEAMRCTCHELSLTMRCAIKSSEETLKLLKTVQKIVVHINGAPTKVAQLQTFQQQLKLKDFNVILAEEDDYFNDLNLEPSFLDDDSKDLFVDIDESKEENDSGVTFSIEVTDDQCVNEAADHKRRGLQLIMNNATRWTTYIKMVRRYLELLQPIALLAKVFKEDWYVLSEMEILQLNELLVVISPFEILITQLESGSVPTLSCIFPFISALKKHLNTEVSESLKKRHQSLHSSTKKFIQGLNAQLDKRFDFTKKTAEPILLATLLDPRFKNFSAALTATFSAARIKLENMVADLELLNSNIPSTQTNTVTLSSVALPASSPSVNLILQSIIDNDGCKQFASGAHQKTRKDECKQYFSCQSPDAASNPLQWWKQHESIYPNLATLARQMLCTPASTASSERIWSIGHNTLTRHRNRMLPSRVSKLIMLKHNLRAFNYFTDAK
jgi:hypothetical protein